MFKNAFLMLGMAAALAPAFAAEWMTDLEAAKAKAAQENKAVLIDFTGSDWCHWCILLREKVLDTPAFETYAKDKFVLMEVDLPNSKPQDPALRAANEKLCDQFRISGFPTVLVISAQGDVLGGFSGGRSTVEETLEPLNEALAMKAKIEAAHAAKGLDRAKAFLDIYNSLPSGVQAHVEKYKQEILDNDPGNVTGFHDVVAAEREMAAINHDVQRLNTPAEGVAYIEARLGKVMPANKQRVLFMLSQFRMMAAETEADILNAKAAALEGAGLVADPAESSRLKEQIERQFASPAAMLQRAKDLRARMQR